MRKIFFTFAIVLSTFNLFAQSSSEIPEQNISPDSQAIFRIFATKNMYTFIKLNTRNGKMWQVQWGMENDYRFETSLSNISLVNNSDERNGRFFLYPTSNIYTFILLDQISGRSWQVQWGKEGERGITAIY
jgi:hypothetical protein